MYEQEYNIELFSKSEFKLAFGEAKAKRRYFCFDCIDDATTGYSSFGDEAKTAFLASTDRERLWCAMCCETFDVKRAPCHRDGCKGNVLGGSSAEHENRCYTCGKYSEE